MSTKTSLHANRIQEYVRACEAIRRDPNHAQDITLAEYLQANGTSMESFYQDLELDPHRDAVQNLVNHPNENYRWLIPEIYRDALRLGLRNSAIYPNFIRGEESVSQTSIKMPAINMSDATPQMLGVAETIPLGDVSFDEKSVKIFKVGRGIKIPYEVLQYVKLSMVSVFLEDYGVKLGMGLDYLAVKTLMNGDQADGSDAAAVIGVTTANTLTYRDLLRPWVRMSRIGRDISNVIAGEEMAIDYLDLLTNTRLEGTPRTNVSIKTPVPQNSNVWAHAGVTDNRLLAVDPRNALIKLNAQPLLVETDKIVSNQTIETYATITTGFATIMRDARLILDKSLAFSGNGFPAFMNPNPEQLVTFK